MTSYISIIINKLIKIYKIKYLGENVTKINNIIFNFQRDNDEVRFLLDQHTMLDFYSASLLKQQSADSHVAPRVHSDTLSGNRVNQSLFFLLNNAACLSEKQQIPVL